MQQAEFDQHAIWPLVDRFQSLMADVDADAPATHSEAVSQLRYLAAELASHKSPSSTMPYSAVTLTNTQSQLTNVVNELANFASNKNPGHLANAGNHAQQVLHILGLWPSQSLRGGAAAQANRVFTEYREAAEAALKALRETNEELRAQLAGHKAEAESALTGLKSEISTLTTKITQDEARLDTALTTTNDAFTAKQTEREEKFNAFVEQQGERLQGLAAEHLRALEDFVVKSRAAYQEVDGLREGTEKVAGLASADILAGKFKEYSDQQWKWGVGANALGFVALALGLGVIVWTLHSIGATETVSWQYTTLKLGVTITIVAASAVAFRLGGLFLSRSSSSKQMELELRAIGPFFADIEDQDALTSAKKAFVERSFGHGWGERPSADGQLSNADSSRLITELTEMIKTVTTRS